MSAHTPWRKARSRPFLRMSYISTKRSPTLKCWILRRLLAPMMDTRKTQFVSRDRICMKKKKIAIVTPYGAAQQYDNYAEFVLAKSLIERGYDARMYTYHLSDRKTFQKDFIYQG